MDSKLRAQAIAIAVCVAALAIAMVFYVNRKEDAAGGNGQAAFSNQTQGTLSEKYTDAELRAFLRDETFFDPDPTPASGIIVRETPQLYLLASSVYKDIRVTVVDESGQAVRGKSFFITVQDQGEYKDLDQDGIIYIPELTAGEYFVSLEAVEGYEVPLDPMRVSVKDQLEYTVIEDISFYIHEESEINAEKEDTEEASAAADAEESEKTEILEVTEAAFGIDVSKWQKDIDWEAVAKSGVTFAIIRCGYRGSSTGCLVEDPYFLRNIQGAKNAGIDVGVYFFTQAVNEVEAVEEASMVVSLCRDYELDYPVFIDTESAGGNGRADQLGAADRTAVCRAFCTTIQNAGYQAGVYASRNWYYQRLEDEKLQEFVLWDAEYRDAPLYTGNYSIWQYTSNGHIDGINTRVDLDLSYIR